MSSPSREFFTLDLRGLRAGLKARAASLGLTESSVVRSILAAALGAERSDSSAPSAGPMTAPQVKLSVRLPRTAASRLDRHARAAGLSRGVYLTRLIDGAPPVVASSDRGGDVQSVERLLERARAPQPGHEPPDAVAAPGLDRRRPVRTPRATIRWTGSCRRIWPWLRRSLPNSPPCVRPPSKVSPANGSGTHHELAAIDRRRPRPMGRAALLSGQPDRQGVDAAPAPARAGPPRSAAASRPPCRRAPQVMVKVTGGGRGMGAIAAHFRYISKNGRLDIEDDRGAVEQGKDAVQGHRGTGGSAAP